MDFSGMTLSGDVVVPEPSSALAVLGALALLRRRRA